MSIRVIWEASWPSPHPLPERLESEQIADCHRAVDLFGTIFLTHYVDEKLDGQPLYVIRPKRPVTVIFGGVACTPAGFNTTLTECVRGLAEFLLKCRGATVIERAQKGPRIIGKVNLPDHRVRILGTIPENWPEVSTLVPWSSE
jgi:hypothetical protein